ARESAGSITVKVDSANKSVSIHSIASQLGENTAEADAKVKGEGEITLNSRYLMDALGVIGDDEVTIGFNGKLEACVLRGASSDGKSADYTHIIMPLKS
ncbi:MAG: DNA polymerase III subunit beta, partial [Candidatus Saccharimonadales bacterium]